MKRQRSEDPLESAAQGAKACAEEINRLLDMRGATLRVPMPERKGQRTDAMGAQELVSILVPRTITQAVG